MYISVSVSCETKEHHCTLRTASYSRSQSHNAIYYIAISNREKLYIYIYLCVLVSVSCEKKEHQYTFRTASYSRSHSHNAIYYIAISNIQHLYIYHFLCHVTQRNISIHFVLPATAGHTATLQYAT